jgi:hypothetical protein
MAWNEQDPGQNVKKIKKSLQKNRKCCTISFVQKMWDFEKGLPIMRKFILMQKINFLMKIYTFN